MIPREVKVKRGYAKNRSATERLRRNRKVSRKPVVRLRVKELVEQRGMTWNKFGEDTGLSKQTVYALMTGKMSRIDLRTLDVLCSYFDVPIGEVVEYISGDAMHGEPQS